MVDRKARADNPGGTALQEPAARVRSLFSAAFQDHKAERWAEAEASYRQILAISPRHADALNLLGLLAHQTGRDDRAVRLIQKAIAIKPDFGPYHSNLAHALIELGRRDEALEQFKRSICLNADFHEAYLGMGILLRDQGLLDESVACFRKLMILDPVDPMVHANLAYSLLMQGHMEEGWKEYEWRTRVPDMSGGYRRFAKPLWKGETADNRTLLIHAEQGLGDTLQFSRYATLAADRGLKVIVEVQKPLERLLRSLHGGLTIIARGEKLPDFDFQIPMMSMPFIFGTTGTTVPCNIPYLHADEAGIATWRSRLQAAGCQGIRVGLVWAGNSYRGAAQLATIDRQRSMEFRQLSPILNVPGLCLVSLQKQSAPPKGFPVADFMRDVADMADTAALIANLDLVVSVDTSVAHLAGALGKPVWLLDRFNHEWRWLAGQNHSPWYPTMRIYRQPSLGQWGPVLTDVARDLRNLVAL